MNRNKFSIEIFELERIINSGFGYKLNVIYKVHVDLTKKVSGRKITPKM